MSNTTNTTNTINISPQAITGKCDLKCAYNFDYPTTSLVATNNGIDISIKFDNQTSTPVTFNNNKYTVQSITIIAPSIHLFNGSQAPAELLINHTPQTGGQQLTVCIPIVQSSNSSDATNLVTEIIQLVSSGAPSEGETTTLNISNFTLNSIVPKKPFYNFNSKILGNCIVYGNTFAIPLSQSTLSTLTSIITPYSLNDVGDGNLFFNSSGPNQSSSGDDGIYISCQPTGNSEETTDTTNNKNSSSSSGVSINFKKYETALWILLLIVIVIGIIALINFVISKNSTPKGLTNSKINPDSTKSFFSGLKDKFTGGNIEMKTK
jgi:carbonic anhydrase